MPRGRYVVPVVVATAFLALHLPALASSLEDLDSINFALGLHRFDVTQHQPHPPGYPIYIAAARVVRRMTASPGGRGPRSNDDARALSLLGVVAGACSIFPLVALFRRIQIDPGGFAPADPPSPSGPHDPRSAPAGAPVARLHCAALKRQQDSNVPHKRLDQGSQLAVLAALLAATAPLYWFTAARPLSDMPGLAAALAVQALTVAATSGSTLVIAAGLAGFAAGVRSQVVWLTVPLIALWTARRPRGERGRVGAGAAAAFIVGVLVWAVPLVALSGGPAAYWRVLSNQGAEDLGGVQMLWTQPTARQLLLALRVAFIDPWAVPAVGAVMVALALLGVLASWRTSRDALVTIGFAFGPYLVFDLLFQETVTTRYALPLVPPVAYLAARGASSIPAERGRRRFGWSRRVGIIGILVLVLFDLAVVTEAEALYAREDAPAFRMLDDMRALEQRQVLRPAPSPVLAMHRREDLDLRRPIAWLGDRMPPVARRLPAPSKHEWLELVKYWNSGGRAEVWFVADPLRTDLALVDHQVSRVRMYRWLMPVHGLLGGVRPDVMDWCRLTDPAWYLGEGWALTPETAGVAEEDRRGPGRAPIHGWIRRRSGETTLMIGGRNLAAQGPPVRVGIDLDGRPIDAPVAAPGFFLRMLHLPPGALEGTGDYATLTVAADRPSLAIEQFNAQAADRVVYGYGDGWQEMEYNPPTGRSWRWMSERAVLRVHAAGQPLWLTMHGDPPRTYFSKPSTVRISAGGRVLGEQTAWEAFDVRLRIPADVLGPGEESSVIIETDQTYVPAERSRRSRDRRHLGLRVFECDLRPASAGRAIGSYR